MSFFGNNNNNNTTGGFGGFGSGAANNNTTTGGFGATSSGGGLFGNNTATSGGFGGGGGGFGATNTNSPFGANKTSAFGAPATTSAGGMFGGNTTTTGGFGSGGGFGANNNNNNNNTSSAFGGGNTGGGLFGTNKPAATGFGATNTGGTIFGGNNTGGGFGNTGTAGSSLFGANNNNNATSGFGANNNAGNSGFGGFGGSTNVNANNNNGTGGTPFQAFTEKDTAANQTSHFQSITFQQPYQAKSFEELRVEDYLQGRRYGNSNGQAGSFGTSTGFGGSVFGGNNANSTSNTGSLFGNNNNNSNNNAAQNNNTASAFTGFGTNNANTNNNTASAFGSNTGGGLFGNQNKPAASGVFGSTPASGTTNAFGNTANTGGSLFGGSFGANNNTPSNTGGSLFGNNTNTNNNATQNKSTFGGFGSNNAASGFGNTNTGGSLFGNNVNNASTTNNSGSLFGNNNQPQQASTFGAPQNNTGSLFGNQNKPAGGSLFGPTPNTNAGSSLFGNNTNNNQQSSGLFGQNNANAGSSLFGNNQNKPAGGSLFGPSNTNANTGGSLFGNNNNQQTSSLFGGSNANTGGSSLFGNNQNKPATVGLFSNTPNTTNTGTSTLFGSNNQQNQGSGSSLFGNLNNNQNQSSNNNSSLFGNSAQQNNNQQSQSNYLHASLNSAAYGNEQLFATLAAASPPIGPLATPLNGARPAAPKTLSLMASTRIHSPSYTPRNGSIGRNGYGFSYSTYGTPNSAYSVNLTPGASSLLKPTGSVGSGLASRLLKSASMNSLRNDGTPGGDSLLRPTPGSISSRYANTGSMRRLNIDRQLRGELFTPPENKHVEAVKDGDRGLKKSVSFEHSANSTDAEPGASNALVRTEDDSQDETPPGLVKAAHRSYPDLSGASQTGQGNGSLSTAVSEGNGVSQQESFESTGRLSTGSLSGSEPGEYWTKPLIKDLKQMSRAQLSKLGGFVVGRDNVGRIEFGPCDLTNVPLDDICGKIVKLVTRSATVYEFESDKPPMGKGLNVPSTIFLERSWPRSQGGKKLITAKQGKDYDKHVARLKRIHDTQFKSYNPDTGIWCFAVEHFTTYGLEDEDDDMTDDLLQDSSGLSDPPATPGHQDGDTMQSMDMSVGPIEDDTFEFKLNRPSQISAQGNVRVPGSIEGVSYVYDDVSEGEDMADNDELRMSGGLGEPELEDPFTMPGGAVQAPSPGAIERFQYSMVLGDDADEIEIAEQTQTEPEPELPGSFNAEGPKLLRSILKPTPAFQPYMSPEKLATTSWEDQLQQTISPKKRDRQALRGIQQTAFKAPEDNLGESLFKRSMLGQSALGQSYLAQKSAKKVGFGTSIMGVQTNDLGKSQAFRTSMDIMNSLWSQEKPTKHTIAVAQGFENPYPKKPRLSASSDLDEQDAAFYDSFKPSFANNGTIVYAIPGAAKQVSGDLIPAMRPFVGEHKEVRFAKWVPATDLNTTTLEAQQDITTIQVDQFPQAVTSDNWHFTNVAETVPADQVREYAIWQLAAVLFDPIDIACGHLVAGVPEEQVQQLETRLRKDGLAEICVKYESDVVEEQIRRARSAEEKALLYLTMNDIESACDTLAQAKDFRLATLVAQLPGSDESRRVMGAQIEAWRERNDWSEMSDSIRAIYSILAGQVCSVSGKNGPAENRATEFNIAARFGLNWLRSFGLRVFFGGFPTVKAAIEAYVDDLSSGRESVHPSPWWNRADDARDGREDTLMSLLRLYTGAEHVDLAALFDPRTVSGSVVSSRLAWQLATLFKAKSTALDPDLLDHLTLSYASELESANKLITSSWVLLHLSSAQVREHTTRGLLERNAARIPEPAVSGVAPATDNDSDTPAYTNFDHLTLTNRIPAPLCWSAKAFHARAHLLDPGLQTLYLLFAGRADDAHAVLCETVGPAAVIEEELKDLREEILPRFSASARRPEGWEEGGAVFEAYAKLDRMTLRQKEGPEGRRVMATLARGIGRMAKRVSNMGLEARVAVYEMERGLKECLREVGEPVEVDFGLGTEGERVGAFERYRGAMEVGA